MDSNQVYRSDRVRADPERIRDSACEIPESPIRKSGGLEDVAGVVAPTSLIYLGLLVPCPGHTLVCPVAIVGT
jgi:hypothetical protein